MSVTYGFYNSINGDRKYNATQMAKIFDGLITDGVFASIGTKFGVVAYNGLSVKVGEGRAWFNHTWTLNDADIELTVEVPNMVYPRIDTVVLEIDTGTRVNSIKVISGIPAVDPVPPTLTNNGIICQHPLANISVPVGLSVITDGNISIRVGSALCPYVTGILENINIDSLFAHWESDFLAWFDSIKGQLSEDAAGALQIAVDALEASIGVLVSAIDSGWFPAEVYTGNGTITNDDVGSFAGITIQNDPNGNKVEPGMRLKYEQIQPLTGYWNFDNNGSESLGLNGIVVSAIGSPTYTSGRIGNALTLNGTNQALNVENNECFKIMKGAHYNEQTHLWEMVAPMFSFGGWVQRTNNSGGTILYVGSGYDEGVGYRLGLDTDGHVCFLYTSLLEEVYIESNETLTPSTLHHIGVTYNRDCLQIYIDGKLDTFEYVALSSIIYPESVYIRIGCHCDTEGSNSGWLNGKIDDFFFIKEYSLSQSDIEGFYKNGFAPIPIPVGTDPLVLTKMGIVLSVLEGNNNWLNIRIWSGIDYSLIYSINPLSNLYFSREREPKGFNSDPRKWRLGARSDGQSIVTTPYLLTNLLSISLPMGEWIIDGQCSVYVETINLEETANAILKISSSYGYVFPELMVLFNGTNGTGQTLRVHGRVKMYLSPNYEDITMIVDSNTGNTASLFFDGTNAPIFLTATCAYL